MRGDAGFTQTMSYQVSKIVWDRSKAKNATRLVLLSIAEHANDKGYAFPSNAKLQSSCQLSERQVRTSLRELETIGELSISLGTGQNGANEYQVLLVPGSIPFAVKTPSKQANQPQEGAECAGGQNVPGADIAGVGGQNVPVWGAECAGVYKDRTVNEPSGEPSVEKNAQTLQDGLPGSGSVTAHTSLFAGLETDPESKPATPPGKKSTPSREKVTSRTKKQIVPPSDEEWLDGLRGDPAFAHVDIDAELAKCSAWCEKQNPVRAATRRTFQNWLSKIEKPLTVVPVRDKSIRSLSDDWQPGDRVEVRPGIIAVATHAKDSRVPLHSLRYPGSPRSVLETREQGLSPEFGGRRLITTEGRTHRPMPGYVCDVDRAWYTIGDNGFDSEPRKCDRFGNLLPADDGAKPVTVPVSVSATPAGQSYPFPGGMRC